MEHQRNPRPFHLDVKTHRGDGNRPNSEQSKCTVIILLLQAWNQEHIMELLPYHCGCADTANGVDRERPSFVTL